MGLLRGTGVRRNGCVSAIGKLQRQDVQTPVAIGERAGRLHSATTNLAHGSLPLSSSCSSAPLPSAIRQKTFRVPARVARYVTRFPSGVQMGNWLLPSEMSLGGVHLGRGYGPTHQYLAPGVMKATLLDHPGDTRGVSYGRPGAFSGSAFPCRSTQTSVRSSKSERPATYANIPLPDTV